MNSLQRSYSLVKVSKSKMPANHQTPRVHRESDQNLKCTEVTPRETCLATTWINRTIQIHNSCVIICHIQLNNCVFLQQSRPADVHWQLTLQLCVWDSPVITRELTTAVQIRFNFAGGQCHAVNWHPLTNDTDPCSPSVYYCNISSFQSLVTSHVYMTLGIRQLPMFASKNKQVVQIWIQVSHVEAVLEGWSLANHDYYVQPLNCSCYIINYFE